jgi:putative NADH-flavin reductase
LFEIRKAKMAKKNKEKLDLPKVHKDLEGFDVTINSFGEIQMSYNIEKINDFLNNKVEDKKLKHLKEDEKS